MEIHRRLRTRLSKKEMPLELTPAAFVNVYLGLGDKEQTFVWFEKAFQERSNYIAYLKVFPLLDPLRSEPRFADLIKRVGL